MKESGIMEGEGRAISDSDIQERMTYHPPSDDGIKRHAVLSELFGNAMREVDRIMPSGREKSIVFTKLEEAKFWASAGVARNIETR